MALTKAVMAEAIYNELGINRREAKELIELFFETLSEQLEKGQEVKLSGFGNFCLRDKTARPGRNPKTGEEVMVSARRVVNQATRESRSPPTTMSPYLATPFHSHMLAPSTGFIRDMSTSENGK